jgi:hypothetical protein
VCWRELADLQRPADQQRPDGGRHHRFRAGRLLPDRRQGGQRRVCPAPLPAGVLEVGGVYLTPPSRGFRASCQRAADRVGFAVPCPGLLPTSAPGRAPRELCDRSSTCRHGQLLGFTHRFVVPIGYVGAPGGSATLGIIATPTRGGAGGLGLRCPGERRIATPTVHRIRAVLAACPHDPRRSVAAGCCCAGRSGARSWWSPHRARVRTGGWSLPWLTTCAWSDPDADPILGRSGRPARRARAALYGRSRSWPQGLGIVPEFLVHGPGMPSSSRTRVASRALRRSAGTGAQRECLRRTVGSDRSCRVLGLAADCRPRSP